MRIGTADSTKILDNACVDEYKIPLIVMMENAVLSAFKHMDIEENQNYVVVSGVGNNGGDGLGLARQLCARGKNVEVFIVGNLEKLSECSKINYNILKSFNISTTVVENENMDELKNSIKRSDIVVDCIFGTGLEREIKGVFYDVINLVNENKNKTYSIDVPSGINATTGDILGTCIKADKTISFEFYKRGFLKYETKEFIGDVVVEHIGIPEHILEKYDNKEYITDIEIIKNNIRAKDKYSFKSDFGKIAFFAGSRGFTGAAYISTQAAVKCGSGLTTLVTDSYVQDIASQKLCEAMTLNIAENQKVINLIKDCDAIGFGCGMGDNDDTYNKLEYILNNTTCPIIIDADGLNVLKDKKELLKSNPNRIIITPHLGEMSRLTGYPINYIRDNKVDAAKEFANKYKVVVLLKGYETVITNGKYTYINPTGNSSMANGGMGDTLLGMITSFVGQGMTNLMGTVCAAYIHGYIGQRLSKDLYTVNASDVINLIPQTMKELIN